MALSAEVPLHRSYLYAPGSNRRTIAKALAAGADAVVLDLEDAVAPAEKAAARSQVAATVAARGVDAACDLHVRVNRAADRYHEDDVRAVVQPGLQALRVPKVEGADGLRELDALLATCEQAAGLAVGSIALYPTIESAVGTLRVAGALSATARTHRVAFGATDFLADIGAWGDEEMATLHVRSQLVLASRAAGVGPPIDSVHTRLDDGHGLRRAAERARALGFFGKSVIHPQQLAIVHEVFTPSEAELRWATRVVEALGVAARAGSGATSVEGQFVDEAIAARARALLSLGRNLG